MIVKIKNVTKSYGKLLALDNLSFSIPKGAIFGLLGPNGAGKTTLLGIICGLIKPDKGDVIISNHSVKEHPEIVKKHIGLLTQRSGFYLERSPLDHLVLYGRLSGIANPKEKAVKMLAEVGLSEQMHFKVKGLSHGMVKLLNLAQAFLASPDVVFLDEPIAGLDPRTAHKIKDFIKKHSKHTTIILSSHYLEAVEKLCDHVAILNEGKLLVEGRLKTVKKGKSLEKVFLDLTNSR